MRMDPKKTIRILGIDPGFGRLGYGVIEGHGNTWKHITHGCIETNKDASFLDRLVQISDELNRIIKEYKPSLAGVEELFFAKNVTTALKVAHARGVILLTLHQLGIPVREYKPSVIKQAVTGHGGADKQQMQRMVKMLLSLESIPKPDDAADALGIALTCGALVRIKG